jgi:hypothetical protein
MPLPILTQIFKQTIKANTEWTASAAQSATCLENIITGVHLSTAAIICARVKKLTTARKAMVLGTAVIITGTIAAVLILPGQDSPSGPTETSFTTVSSENYESDANFTVTYSFETTTFKQIAQTDVSSSTKLSSESLPKVTEPQNFTNSTSLDTSTSMPTTTPSVTTTESLTRLNGILIKNLEIFDEANSDLWSIKYGFAESNKIFSDRDFTFVTIPDSLSNHERIQLACNSKYLQTDVAKFTAGNDITVYIGMDSRTVAKGLPTWIDSWTPAELDAFLSDDVTSIFYKKDFAKGAEVTLGTNGDPSSVIMYTVFVASKT